MRLISFFPVFFAMAIIASTFPVLVFAQSTGASTASLEEVISVSSRIEVPRRQIATAVSVLSGEEIERRGYASMIDVLRNEPSVGVSNAGGLGKISALRIRGEEGYRTLVRIDGIDVSDPSSTQVAPSVEHLLATREIDRVEVLRGPQGFIYGADAGGVVNILSRRGGGELTGGLGIEWGDAATRRIDADVSAGGDRGDFLLSLADIESDGFNSRIADTGLADDDGYENTTAHAKFGWAVDDDLRLELVARNVDARFEFDRCGFPSTDDCVGETEQDALRLSADWSRARLTHLFAWSETDTGRRNFAAGADAFSTTGSLSRAEYTGSYTPSASSTLVYGVDLEQEEVVGSGGIALSRRQDAYYFEYQGRFLDHLFVTLGARRDDNDDFGSHVSSRASVAFLDSLPGGGTLKYRTSIGTGFRAPSLAELAYNRGPFALPPAAGSRLIEESSRGYDIGVEFATAAGALFAVTYFAQTLEDEIFFDLVGFSGYLQASGDGQSRGIELVAQLALNERWQLIGNALINDTETTEGLQRIRRPERTANFGISYSGRDSKLRMSANWRLAEEAVDELFGIGRVALGDYSVLDVTGSYSLSDSVEVFGRVQNLLDEDYQEVTGFNTAGVAAYVGMRLRFGQ